MSISARSISACHRAVDGVYYSDLAEPKNRALVIQQLAVDLNQPDDAPRWPLEHGRELAQLRLEKNQIVRASTEFTSLKYKVGGLMYCRDESEALHPHGFLFFLSPNPSRTPHAPNNGAD